MLLVQPYFQTEIIEEVANSAVAQSEIEINEIVNKYLRNPNTEEDSFIITTMLYANQTVSDYSL